MNESISELQNIWSKVKKELETTVEDARFFDVFLSDSSIHSIQEDSVIVSVGSKLAVSILGTKFLSNIEEAISNVLGVKLKVIFDTKENLKTSSLVEAKPTFFKNSPINPSLTFDTFVTGASNLEAKQAALYIASNPGKGFNPLFIYSNPGLGKTHLLQAIVNHLRETAPGKRALYCDSTDFFQEFINYATGEKKQDTLKDYIIGFDVFLIDDIQNLASKEQTCKFFFEIYNLMHSKGKQIVITSDKHPAELKYFEDRLKSRMQSGLTVTIAQPDVSTCVSVLENKIANSPIDVNCVDPQVLNFIANKFSKSIRNLDEAFNKLVWYVTSFRPVKYVDMEIATEALQNLIDIRDEKKKMSEQRILTVVSDYYNLTPSQLIGSSRQGNIVMARHISWYLIKTMLDVPYTKIGLMFGGKDHSTVMSGVEKVEKEVKINTSLSKAIEEIQKQLKS